MVDDEAKIRLLVRQFLEAEGFEVIEAGNGPDGLVLAWHEVDLPLRKACSMYATFTKSGGFGCAGVMAFRRAADRFWAEAVSCSLRWERLRRGSTVLLRPSDNDRWRWGSRRIGTWTYPSDATLCAHSDGDAGVFVSLRAIVGRRCVPIRRAQHHRSEPSPLEASRTQIGSLEVGIAAAWRGSVRHWCAPITTRSSNHEHNPHNPPERRSPSYRRARRQPRPSVSAPPTRRPKQPPPTRASAPRHHRHRSPAGDRHPFGTVQVCISIAAKTSTSPRTVREARDPTAHLRPRAMLNLRADPTATSAEPPSTRTVTRSAGRLVTCKAGRRLSA